MITHTEDEGTLLDYAMAIAHERELNVLGHYHDSDGAVLRFRSAVRRALRATGGQEQDRLDRLYLALEVCSAELFAQCAHQGRAMKYVEQARYALAAEQCARAAQAKHGDAQQ